MSLDADLDIRRGVFRLKARLQLEARGTTALFGPSGCGKTSILRAVAGLDRHPGSTLRFNDQTWQSDSHFLPPHERPVGYVFQGDSLFPHLTVQRNLDYGYRRIAPQDRRIVMGDIIDLLDLGKLMDRQTDGLSGGERQRVSIGRALAVSPQLMLMDEPLAALDIQRKAEILPYLEALNEELDMPMIYVSHSPDEVARIADQMVLMEQGLILAHGPVTELLTRLDLPLAVGTDAEALLEARVSGHDDTFHLTVVDFPGGRFSVPRKDLPVGSKVRVRVAARDVSLTLERQSGTSILNIFPAVVESMTPAGEAQMVVRLNAGGSQLLARITRKSADSLALASGCQVYVQAKSVALLA